MLNMDIYNISSWSDLARDSSYSAGKLSVMVGCSRRQLQRHTQLLFGHSPQAILNQLRLVEAPILLDRCLSAKQVAFMLGFKQPSHFSRSFKLHYGAAPMEFLKSKRLSHNAK